MKLLQRCRRLIRWQTSSLAVHWLFVFLLASTGLAEPLRLASAMPSTLPGVSSLSARPYQKQTPFMHKPYYGTVDFQARITSYFDHDKPWYANDRVFVRYDGKRWKGSDTSVVDCQPGATCYDGHNGYDLRMRFEPVLSSSAGKVINAGWYNPQNHNDSFGLWVAVDHGNGLANVYGHLSALTVTTGQQVGAQWQVGTSGTTGSSTGPHLHFGTYYYPSWQPTDPFGWTSKRANPNTVPDFNLWSSGDNVTPVPLLGGRGKKLAPGAVLVDDSSPDWSSTGQWSHASAKSDIGESLRWTSTTRGHATATATWRAVLPADGYYEVGTYVDDNHASSGWASYTILSSDPDHPNTTLKHRVQVDQEHVGIFQNTFGGVNTGAQWIGLGTYYFRSGQKGSVTLTNATGEDRQQITADGIEFAPLSPQSYDFQLSGETVPPQIQAGERTTVDLTLKNTSSFRWPAQGLQAVQLVYRWLDSQGHTVMSSSPISLSQDLAVHATETSTVDVQSPVQAGTYTLQWDLTQGTQFFSLQGAHPKSQTVIINDPDSAPVTPPGASPVIPPGADPIATPGTTPVPSPGLLPAATPGVRPTTTPGTTPTPSPGLSPAATPDVRPTTTPGITLTPSPGPGSAPSPGLTPTGPPGTNRPTPSGSNLLISKKE